MRFNKTNAKYMKVGTQQYYLYDSDKQGSQHKILVEGKPVYLRNTQKIKIKNNTKKYME